jgi:hypothetical protein
VPTTTKYCPKCETVRKHKFFPRNRSRHDGLGAHCLFCTSEYNNAYRARKRAEAEAAARNGQAGGA